MFYIRFTFFQHLTSVRFQLELPTWRSSFLVYVAILSLIYGIVTVVCVQYVLFSGIRAVYRMLSLRLVCSTLDEAYVLGTYRYMRPGNTFCQI